MSDFKVDICATILADKPPQLPLREELNSLGFEVIYNAAGTGVKAVKHDTKRNVERFRKTTQIKDLRKRWFFPKSSKRIKAKLAERKQIETDLALPHACSYQSYGKELLHDTEVSSSDDSSFLSYDEDRAKKRWGMFKRRQKQQQQQQQQQHIQSVKSDSDFHMIAAQAVFPDFLAPFDVPQQIDPHPVSTQQEPELRDRWKEAFAALDALNDDESSRPEHTQEHLQLKTQNVAQPAFSNVASMVFQATHVDDGDKNQKQEIFNWVSNEKDINAVNSGTSATTGVFDGIDTDGDNTCAVEERVLGDSPNDVLKWAGMERQGEVQVGGSKSGLKQNAGAPDNAFENVPLDFYANIETTSAPEHLKKPFGPGEDLNFDESFAVKLTEAKSSKVSKASKTQDAFENVSSELYKAAGMDSPKSGVSKKLFGVVTSDGDFWENGTKAGSTGVFNKSNIELQETGKKAEKFVEENPQNAFDRATAEICKAVGIEKPGTGQGGSKRDRTQDGPIEWMASAKHVFDNFSSGIFQVTGFDQPVKEDNPDLKGGRNPGATNESGDISVLQKLISLVGTPTHAIEGVLHTNPELLQVRHHHDGRLPLHAICDRGMPDRSSVSDSTLTDFLLKDIASCKRLVNSAVNLYPGGCLMQDKRFDLPVHLMARNLMEWEATWYEAVYQKAANERGESATTAFAITKLYHTMSETVESLMIPLFKNFSLSPSLCRAPGSMGTILPLHIATIFTVSVRTLRLVLEAYPDAASVHCDLGILQTFIPDECLPLELHDNLSTDFPKWEIEAKEGTTSERSELEENSEDCMRRSDLLFAYNPIEPHRFEKARIRRIESRIQFDATMVVGKSSKRMSRANELLWIWMCTFREPDNDRPTYMNSVKRIVSTLSFQSIRYLASVKTTEDGLIVDAANPECLKVIQRRLEHITDQHQATHASASKVDQTHELMELSQEKHVVGHICRLVFNVPVTHYPTSFVVLPYKLSRNDDGVFGLASPDFSSVATKFAQCLLNMTDPRTILHVLDMKSIEHYDQSIYDSTADDAFYLETIARIEGYEESLLDLYEPGNGYLYMIDETTGLPRVAPSDPVYPIVLRNPSSLVRRLLPLMMMGMVEMRGEKAISKLISVLLDNRVAAIPPTWKEAAKMLAEYLEAQEVGSPMQNTDAVQTKHSLHTFQSSCQARQRAAVRPKNGLTEWNAELSTLKKLLDANDPDRLYSGLPVPMSTTQYVDQGDGGAISYVQCNLAEELTECPGVDDLSRKMDELAQLQSATTGRQRQTSPVPLNGCLDGSRSYSFDDDVVLIGNTFSVAEEKMDVDTPLIELIDDPKGRKHMVSKYSLLFDDLAMDKPDDNDETRDVEESDVRIWNASERVWEDVTCQLNTRACTFCEDSQILQLKVALAEQAKKLAQLGKKVTLLKDEEQRLFAHEDEIRESARDQEAHSSDFASRDSLSSARNLVHRMCDLEERLVCDEIKIQHLSIETYQLEEEGEEMTTCFGERTGSRFRPENTSFLTFRSVDDHPADTICVDPMSVECRDPSSREDRCFKENATNDMRHSSFLKQEKTTSKMVRFDDALLRYNVSLGPYSERGSTSNESSSSESVQFLMTVGGAPDHETNRKMPPTPDNKSATTRKSAFSGDQHPTMETQLPIKTSFTTAERRYGHRDTMSTQATMSNMTFVGAATARHTFSVEPPAKVVRFGSIPEETEVGLKLQKRREPDEKDLLGTYCDEGGQDKPNRNSRKCSENDQRVTEATKTIHLMLREFPQSLERKSDAKYANNDRISPGRADESAFDVTGTTTSTESVFRQSRPTRTISFNTPLPPREFSGLSERTMSSDLVSSQKEVEIDNLISKYTTEANARISSSAAWMKGDSVEGRFDAVLCNRFDQALLSPQTTEKGRKRRRNELS